MKPVLFHLKDDSLRDKAKILAIKKKTTLGGIIETALKEYLERNGVR